MSFTFDFFVFSVVSPSFRAELTFFSNEKDFLRGLIEKIQCVKCVGARSGSQLRPARH